MNKWMRYDSPDQIAMLSMTEAETRERTRAAWRDRETLGKGGWKAVAAVIVTLTLWLGLAPTGHAVVFEAGSALVVSTELVDKTSTELSQKISEAEQAGKNVEAEFYKTLRQMLQELRVLMAEATKNLDEAAQRALRKTFSELKALVGKTDEVTKERAIEMMMIANSLNQVVADIPGVTDRTMVTGVWPTTISQRAQGEVEILVLGVGLVEMKEVTLRLGDKTFRPTTNLGNKLTFMLPRATFAHREKVQKTVQAQIVMDPGWSSRNVKVPVGFKVLPEQVAQIELKPTIGYLEREYAEPIVVKNAKLAAKNTRASKSVKPTRAEWKIDTESIKVRQTGGEKSSGWMYEGAPTENGFAIAFDLGKVRRTGKSSKPGWALFDYSFREFRDVPATRGGKTERLTLASSTGAVAWTMEHGTIAVGGTITDFTGKTYVIVPGRTSYGWVNLEYISSAKQVVVETEL